MYCRFEYNTADGGDGGGGIEHVPLPENGGNITLDHCLIQHNIANAGGAIWQGRANFLISNCTIAHNLALDDFESGGGGGINVWHSSPYTINLQNSILWGDTAASGREIFFGEAAGTVIASFCDIQGSYPGIGNIDADPMFVDTANGDFHLQVGSPCIDAGDPNSPLDPDGSRADMGAFPLTGPRIRVVSPNGGENWTLFTTDTVRWQSWQIDGNVMIELTRNYPNGPWDTLAFDTPNDSAEAVFIPEPISSLCRVRVTALDMSLSDISDANFVISPSQGYLALVRPAQPSQAVLSWNLGSMECPQTVLESFRLKNFGTAPITVYRPENLTNPAFSRTTNCPLSFTIQPGEMTSCELGLNFAPESDGFFRDTLRIRTNASNAEGLYVRIPLSGTQISTPATPQVVITTQGQDARLTWHRITESVGGCAIDVTRYLVFFSEVATGPFWFHGYTADSTYLHIGVVQYAANMFYHVTATTAPAILLETIPAMTKEEDIGWLLTR
jgi:hypothetical protein